MRHNRLRKLLLLSLLLLIPVGLVAQDESDDASSDASSSDNSTFDLTGTSYIESQYADRQGVGQSVPETYTRWYFTPTAILFDIPFTGSLLVSTEQSRGRQSINSVNLSFSLDQEQLQARLRERLISQISSSAFAPTIDRLDDLEAVEAELSDPERLADVERLRSRVDAGEASLDEIEELESLEARAADLRDAAESLKGIREKVGEAEELREMAETGFPSDDLYDPDHLRGALSELEMLSGVERFLYNFPRFGVGVNYPTYTPFVMNGVAVNGLDVVFNPGDFYLATTVGTASRDVPEALAEDTTYVAFDRTLYAGRVGIGREGGTRFLLSALYAGDGEDAVIVDTATGFYLAPQENWVLGFEAVFDVVPDVFAINSEIAGSILSGDLSSPELDIGDEVAAPGWLVDLVGFRTSSFLDFAFSIEPVVNISETGTELSGSYERIGPGYVSLGIPYLRNDRQILGGKIRQRLIDRQVTIDAGITRETDNLFDTKSSTTEISSMNLGLALRFRKLPFLRASWRPYRQNNGQSGEFAVDNTIDIITATLGHRYRFGRDFGGMTSMTFLRNDVETLGGVYDSRTTTWILTQLFSIGSDLTISGTGSLTDPVSTVDTLGQITTIELGADYTFFEDWSISAGGVLTNEEGGTAQTGFFGGLLVPIDVIGSLLDIRFEQNTFDAERATLTGQPAFDELVVRASLSTSW